MAFLDSLAYGGPQTWRDLLEPAEPCVDGMGLLAPPWGDAIRAAVSHEKQYGGDSGEAGQVIECLIALGHEPFADQAEATEQAAHQGNLQLQGSGLVPVIIGIPMGIPVAPPAGSPDGCQAPHLMCLAAHQKMEVKEKASLIEAITAMIGQEIEMANKYQIFSQGGGEELFFAVEETSCCMRQAKQCCPDCAPWTLSMLFTQGGQHQIVYSVERPWTCTCCCFNRPKVTVTDVTTGQLIGSIQDPWACFDLTYRVRDPNDIEVLKVKGGCCQWGLCCPLPCGPCAEVNFDVEDVSSGEDVAHLQKRVPGCCKFFFAPDVDNYKVDFGSVSHPEWKALLLTLAIFIDFRYFNENSNDDNGGLGGMMTE